MTQKQLYLIILKFVSLTLKTYCFFDAENLLPVKGIILIMLVIQLILNYFTEVYQMQVFRQMATQLLRKLRLRKQNALTSFHFEKDKKNNSVVIANKVVYSNRIKNIVQDQTKFEKIEIKAKILNFQSNHEKRINEDLRQS